MPARIASSIMLCTSAGYRRVLANSSNQNLRLRLRLLSTLTVNSTPGPRPTLGHLNPNSNANGPYHVNCIKPFLHFRQTSVRSFWWSSSSSSSSVPSTASPFTTTSDITGQAAWEGFSFLPQVRYRSIRSLIRP